MESQLLLHSIADKRAETKFHYIMQIIRHKESKDKNKLLQDVQEDDDLITYNEFHDAVKTKSDFYKTILPRTLSIQEVLL